MRPHQQVPVSGHTQEQHAAFRRRRLLSPHPGRAQLTAKAMIYPSQGCGMQKAGAGAIHHQAHNVPQLERGVPGAGMESIHLVGGRGSAARGGSAGELRSRLPFLCRGFWRSWTTWLQGPAGLGSSPRPPPTHPGVGMLRPLVTKAPRNIFNQCKIGPDGAGRAMGGACSGHGRVALCVGASGAPGPALPAIEVTDEWDVPDAPHSLGQPL